MIFLQPMRVPRVRAHTSAWSLGTLSRTRGTASLSVTKRHDVIITSKFPHFKLLNFQRCFSKSKGSEENLWHFCLETISQGRLQVQACLFTKMDYTTISTSNLFLSTDSPILVSLIVQIARLYLTTPTVQLRRKPQDAFEVSCRHWLGWALQLKSGMGKIAPFWSSSKWLLMSI